jgi:hypothetical protein
MSGTHNLNKIFLACLVLGCLSITSVQAAVKDTDADGLSDQAEMDVYLTSPTNPDTDGDSISDSTEVLRGTNPLSVEHSSQTNDSHDWWTLWFYGLSTTLVCSFTGTCIYTAITYRKNDPEITPSIASPGLSETTRPRVDF